MNGSIRRFQGEAASLLARCGTRLAIAGTSEAARAELVQTPFKEAPLAVYFAAANELFLLSTEVVVDLANVERLRLMVRDLKSPPASDPAPRVINVNVLDEKDIASAFLNPADHKAIGL